jgi:hypothetical protein
LWEFFRCFRKKTQFFAAKTGRNFENLKNKDTKREKREDKKHDRVRAQWRLRKLDRVQLLRQKGDLSHPLSVSLSLSQFFAHRTTEVLRRRTANRIVLRFVDFRANSESHFSVEPSLHSAKRHVLQNKTTTFVVVLKFSDLQSGVMIGTPPTFLC